MSFLDRHVGRLAWALIALLCVVYFLSTRDFLFFIGGDNANYLLLARAIEGGEGYRDTFLAGSPPHVHYPPLFPLVLAGLIALFGNNVFIMKLFVSLGAAASLILSYILVGRRKFAWPFVSAIWLGFSLRFFIHTDLLLTESIFMAFSLAAMVAFVKWEEEGGKKNIAAAVLLCWAAVMTRTAGVSLALAMGLVAFFRAGRNKRAAILALCLTIACLIPLLAWSIRNEMISDVSTSYLSQFLAVDPYDASKGSVTAVGLAIRLWENSRLYFTDTVGVLWPEMEVSPNLFHWAAAFLLWALFALGYAHRLRSKAGIMEAFTLAFLYMTLLWPFANYRFIMPLYPLLFAYIAEGAHFMTNRLVKTEGAARKAVVSTLGTAFLLILLFNTVESIKYQRSLKNLSQRKVQTSQGIYLLAGWSADDRMLSASLWLAVNGEKGSVVMARKPRLVALASGHTVVGVPAPVPENPTGWLKENKVRYVLVDEAFPEAAQFMNAITRGKPALAGKPIPGLTIPHKLGDTAVVELNDQ